MKFSALGGLVVVVPAGFDTSRVPEIVDGKRAWIARVARRLMPRMNRMESEPELPDTVMLRAAGKTVRVVYAFSVRPFSVREKDDILELCGRYDAARVHAVLRDWLRHRARHVLVPMLLSLAKEYRISVQAVHIRLQRSRWGSCSAAGSINLNARLLFLPEELARYVCAHELAHRVYHNHSPAFWAHLESLMPGAGRLDRELRDAGDFVPRWAFVPAE
ncbi:zinc protease [Desulfovibrio psychrotolerans]|uniref:Zinc protease n=1 Tax=Desulfovibrio psychrotolerans TaxID=415242 RepID=A0A7J0BWB5_9BACT|nr:zinc protease [Desulfovibrio psychrotolerans]